MDLYQAWKSLNDSADSRAVPIPADPVEALVDLLTFAHERPRLDTVHPWELAPRVARELHERCGYTPVGSWANLVGLAAGAGAFHAAGDGFVPMMSPTDVVRTRERASQRLVEAFTCRLIPPMAAAALYVALEVHPVWGLRLGRHVGAMDGDTEQTESLLHVEELVFGTIATLVAILRGLRRDRRYPVEALATVLEAIVAQIRDECLPADSDEFPPVAFPDGDGGRRAYSMKLSTDDLLDYVLVPAGVARRDDTGWFAVEPSRLLGIRVGPYSMDEQEGWLSQLLWGTRRAC